MTWPKKTYLPLHCELCAAMGAHLRPKTILQTCDISDTDYKSDKDMTGYQHSGCYRGWVIELGLVCSEIFSQKQRGRKMTPSKEQKMEYLQAYLSIWSTPIWIGPPPSLLNSRKWNIFRHTYNLVHPHLDLYCTPFHEILLITCHVLVMKFLDWCWSAKEREQEWGIWLFWHTLQ